MYSYWDSVFGRCVIAGKNESDQAYMIAVDDRELECAPGAYIVYIGPGQAVIFCEADFLARFRLCDDLINELKSN